MCWRQVSKLQKTALVAIFYLTLYLLISYALTPEATVTFVSDDFRVGDKYALMFLIAPQTQTFSDVDGANVFATRRCGSCFITNNKGFLPLTEYDAVLVYGERSLLSETSAFMEPGKRYLIETNNKCIRDKLRGCNWEPKITSFSNKKTYNLCSLCDDLLKKRKPES